MKMNDISKARENEPIRTLFQLLLNSLEIVQQQLLNCSATIF